MAGRLLFPEQRALDDTGAPIGGAKLYTFSSGTTSNLTTYTTSALSVARTNPVVADENGRFGDIWAPSDTAYRLVITDGSEDAYIDGTPLDNGDHDPIYALGTSTNPAPLLKSSTYVLTSDDLGKNLYATGTWVLTLPLGAGLSAGWRTGDLANVGSGTITATAQGGDTIATISGSAATLSMGRTTTWILEWTGSTWKALEASAGTGRHALWVPAESMLSRLTNGPGVSVSETATNKINRRTLDFSNSANQYAQFRVVMPKSWDKGTVTFLPVWTHGSTTTNFNVSWNLQAVAISDQDPGDATFGTVQTSLDTGGTSGTIYKGPESAPITVAGSPQPEDVVVFQIYRETSGVTGNMAISASLIGVVVYLNIDAGSDV